MNWLNDSHQTITVLNIDGSADAGTGTIKFSNVFTSPIRTILDFCIANSGFRLEENRREVELVIGPRRNAAAKRNRIAAHENRALPPVQPVAVLEIAPELASSTSFLIAPSTHRHTRLE